MLLRAVVEDVGRHDLRVEAKAKPARIDAGDLLGQLPDPTVYDLVWQSKGALMRLLQRRRRVGCLCRRRLRRNWLRERRMSPR